MFFTICKTLEMELRICKCGCIHILDAKPIEEALEKHKEILLICGNCGTAFRVGTDATAEACADEGPNLYERIIMRKATIITEDSFADRPAERTKPFDKIYHNKGYRVPMMTGQMATRFDGRLFVDDNAPDFLKDIDRPGATVNGLREEYDQWKTDRVTVDMCALVNELGEENAQWIATQRVPGLDFSKTEYAKYVPKC